MLSSSPKDASNKELYLPSTVKQQYETYHFLQKKERKSYPQKMYKNNPTKSMNSTKLEGPFAMNIFAFG